MVLPDRIQDIVRAIVKQWVLVVAGGARCGSSAMMKQLEAIGIPLTGTAPMSVLREDSQLRKLPDDPSWVHEARGHAIKFLNPHVLRPPNGPPYRWIWLDRNMRHQQRSQVKAAQWMGVYRKNYNIRDWRRRSLRVIERLGGDVLLLTFEGMLADPEKHATRVANYCSLPRETIPVMASVIDRREPACLPHMAEGSFEDAIRHAAT